MTPQEQIVLDELNAKADALGLRRKPGQPRPAQPPGLLRRVASFAGAVTRHVMHGLPVVSDDEKERRLAICRGCEFYDEARNRCLKCGCRGGMFDMKVGWADMRCPIGKW